MRCEACGAKRLEATGDLRRVEVRGSNCPNCGAWTERMRYSLEAQVRCRCGHAFWTGDRSALDMAHKVQRKAQLERYDAKLELFRMTILTTV